MAQQRAEAAERRQKKEMEKLERERLEDEQRWGPAVYMDTMEI